MRGTQNLIHEVSCSGCQLMNLDKPKSNIFIIRVLQMTTVVERMFSVDTPEERLA